MADPLLTPEERAEWSESLDRFDREVWPLFRARGYSKDVALVMWEVARVQGKLTAFGETLTAILRELKEWEAVDVRDDGDDEAWRHG